MFLPMACPLTAAITGIYQEFMSHVEAIE